MSQLFYKIPTNFSDIIENTGENRKICSEKESINQYIELLLMTCPGEHRFDKNFGSKIWDMDFERVVSRIKWENEFCQYMQDSITNYEHRITNVEITASIQDAVREDPISKSVSVKKKVIVKIACRLLSTGEQCLFYNILYLGPLSSE